MGLFGISKRDNEESPAAERDRALLTALLSDLIRAETYRVVLRWEELPQRDAAFARATAEELRQMVRFAHACRWLEEYSDSDAAFRAKGLTAEGYRQLSILEGKGSNESSFPRQLLFLVPFVLFSVYQFFRTGRQSHLLEALGYCTAAAGGILFHRMQKKKKVRASGQNIEP